MLGKVIRQSMFGQSKGYPTAHRGAKGRLKGYILHPPAVKINCKSYCKLP